MFHKKVKELDKDITMLQLLEVVCQDIENNAQKEEYNVLKTTKMNNIAEWKDKYF